MKTNLNRIQNFDAVKVPKFSEETNKTKNLISSKIDNILSNNKVENFSENPDLTREIMLAKIFWLKQKNISRLAEDYNEPLSLSHVLKSAEDFWNYQKVKKSSQKPINNDVYSVAA